MKLFYKIFGEGQPLIILHGLFGQSDNWNTLGKKFAEQGYEVYLVDLRNHGNSPHSDVWTYKVMSDDIIELINDLHLENNKIILMGHSMGGKVAMKLALEKPHLLDKLIVVDIAPKFHVPDNDDVMKALNAINLSTLKSRKKAEQLLSDYIDNSATRQFLLKNLQWKNDSEMLDWKFNKKVMVEQIKNISEDIETTTPCPTNTLFIRGEKSSYVLDEDLPPIKKMFPNSNVVTIQGASHWVHADKPLEFFDAVINFIK